MVAYLSKSVKDLGVEMHLKSVALQLKSFHNSDSFETLCKIPVWKGQEDELLRQKSNIKFEGNLCYVYLHIFQIQYYFQYNIGISMLFCLFGLTLQIRWKM